MNMKRVLGFLKKEMMLTLSLLAAAVADRKSVV